jgi:hypothetical protein
VPEADAEQVEIFVESADARDTQRRRPAEEETMQRRQHPGRGARTEDDERDEEERPIRRRRREDEDDEEDRPVRRKKKRKKTAGSGGTLVLTVALAVGGLVVLGGLGVGVYFAVHALVGAYGKHEAAAKETISVFTELADALESVKDPRSALAAAPRIERVCDRMEQLEATIKNLPKLSREDDEKLVQKYKPEMTKLNERILRVAVEAGVNSQAEPTFMSALLRLKNVEEKLQQTVKNK